MAGSVSPRMSCSASMGMPTRMPAHMLASCGFFAMMAAMAVVVMAAMSPRSPVMMYSTQVIFQSLY